MKRISILDSLKFISKRIKVSGWVNSRRDHGKLIFIDLRDFSGILQVVFSPNINKDAYKIANKLRPEWVVEIIGKTKERPKNLINPKIKTGRIELEGEKLIILNKAKTPPFEISERKEELKEEIRMKYRYLDLRREKMKENLILRQKVINFMRNFLTKKGFIEIETPILGKSTPEGARDFLIPSRLHPGKFYALPQSPQQYKQLLIVSGFEKYFQIARCFRDEDPRADRQAEFTQLDLEMAFGEQEDILNIIEELYIETIKKITPQKNISQIPFPRITYKEAMEKYHTDKPDLRKNKNDLNELAFVFITDFFMFEWKEEENRWDTVHHPFTRPQTENIEEIKKQPSKILAYQYDLVLNGYEIGGGSLRSYKPEILEAVFETLGHKKEKIRQKFGHLLEAFEYGVPPHGGIALGIDRLITILANESSIREVIAFPKTGDGRDLLMNGPSEVEKEQLKELHLKTISPLKIQKKKQIPKNN